MFQHDLSEPRGTLPRPDGTFLDSRLHAALDDGDDKAVYVLQAGEHPAGLALVRGLTSDVHVLTSFFVVRGLRRVGVGRLVVQDLVTRHPGIWEVAFQNGNKPAAHFWLRIAQDLDEDRWTLERRTIPARPDLPPDVWIRFHSPDRAGVLKS